MREEALKSEEIKEHKRTEVDRLRKRMDTVMEDRKFLYSQAKQEKLKTITLKK